MNAVQRIAKNIGVLLLSKVISRVLAFFYIMYAARYLGAERFGILSFALAFTGIFGVLMDLGLEQLTIREVARNRPMAKRYFFNVALMKGILVIITLGIMVLVIHFMGYPRKTVLVVYIIALYVGFEAFNRFFYAIFQAFEEMEYVSFGQILESGLIFLGVLLAIRFRIGLVGFADLFLFAGVIALCYCFVVLHWKFSAETLLPGRIDRHFWAPTIKEALPFGISMIFVTVYFWIDTVMLSWMKGNEVVGWYNAAYRLIFGLMLIPSVSVAAIFPVMSRHFRSARNLLEMEFEITFKYLFITALFIFVFGFLFAKKAITVIYGGAYAPSIVALQVLIWVIPVIFLTFLFGNFLAAVDKQKVVTMVAGANACLNIILNLFLIPKFGYIGASIATVLTEMLGLVLMGTYISKYFQKISVARSVIRPVICILLTAFALCLLKQRVYWLVAGFLGFLFYFLFLFLFRVVSREDVRLAKREILG